MIKTTLGLLLILTCRAAIAQVTYPDANLPGDTPQLFAKGIMTDGLANRDFAISPAGDEIYFTLQQPRFASSTILRLTKKNGKWSKPEVAPFSGTYKDLEAAFSPDGQYIYFSSNRPVSGDKLKDFDIWRVKRTSGGWGQPENLGPVVNSEKDEFYPSVGKSGNLYYTAELPYGKGSEDIVVSKFVNGAYTKPEILPEDINTANDEFNAFVDPDEQFILLTSYKRADDLGRGDIYISHKDALGNWTPVKHLPSPVNSEVTDYCPYVTYDKKYLIFTSARLSAAFTDGKPKNYEQLKKLVGGPGNGSDDIYWVKFNMDWLK